MEQFSEIFKDVEDFNNEKNETHEKEILKRILKGRKFQILILSNLEEYQDIVHKNIAHSVATLKERCIKANENSESSLIYFDSLFLIERLILEAKWNVTDDLLLDFLENDIEIIMKFYKMKNVFCKYERLAICNNNLDWIVQNKKPEFTEKIKDNDVKVLMKHDYIDQIDFPKLNLINDCVQVAQTSPKRFDEIANPEINYINCDEQQNHDFHMYDNIEEYQNYIRTQLKKANTLISQKLNE